jgi:hypothetical protein
VARYPAKNVNIIGCEELKELLRAFLWVEGKAQ